MMSWKSWLWPRVAASIFLSILFLAVYGGSNWYTARLPNIPSFFFEWERMIPFVPAMILPYMSIDLFFVCAPLLCRTKEEVMVFVKRMSFSIIVGGAFFLIVPLKFSFTRPHADGVLGAVFDWFRDMDQPYNQYPSLHITLQMVLLELYGSRTRGLVKACLTGWFILVILSTLLTYQHHVIDVIGGALLGFLALRLFKNPALQESGIGVT